MNNRQIAKQNLEDNLPFPSPAAFSAALNGVDTPYQRLMNLIQSENDAMAFAILKTHLYYLEEIRRIEQIDKNDSRLQALKEKLREEEIEIISANKNALSTYKIDQQMSPEDRNSFLTNLVQALTTKIASLKNNITALQQNITQAKQTLMNAVGNQWQARQQQMTTQLAQTLQAQNLVFQNAQGNLIAANAPQGVGANGQPLPTLAQQLAQAAAPANIVNLAVVNPAWVLERQEIQREIEAEIAAKTEKGVDISENEDVKLIDISKVEYNKMDYLGHIRLINTLAENLGIQFSGSFIKKICKEYPNIINAIEAVKKQYKKEDIQDIKKTYELATPMAQTLKENTLTLAKDEVELQKAEKLKAEVEKKLDKSNQQMQSMEKEIPYMDRTEHYIQRK